MISRRAFFILAAGLMCLPPLLSPIVIAADGGSSSLPRREDVSYRMPGVGTLASNTLSWQVKVGGLPAFSAIYDSLTPSIWLAGPVYTGLSWFWRENGLPGSIDFVGYADASLDTTIYTTPVEWLPLDPVAAGNWSTTSIDSKGATFHFEFSYDGLDSVIAGAIVQPDTFLCWRIILTQSQITGAVSSRDGLVRDGLGVWRKESMAKPGSLHSAQELQPAVLIAVTDTLWYEADSMPRRRIAYRDDFPQNELLYSEHTTRETPVSGKETDTGSFKARWR